MLLIALWMVATVPPVELARLIETLPVTGSVVDAGSAAIPVTNEIVLPLTVNESPLAKPAAASVVAAVRPPPTTAPVTVAAVSGNPSRLAPVAPGFGPVVKFDLA